MDNHNAFEVWKRILTRNTNLKPTDAVVEELVAYSGLTVEEVRALASNSGAVTAQKWDAIKPTTPETWRAFYISISSWVFGTLSYHARQAEGDYPPLPVQAIAALAGRPPGEFLDFGSGVGTASLLFAHYGWRVTLADVSPPLLEFARWRLAQHGVAARFVDLLEEKVETNAHDVVAGFNTMAHIVDIDATLRTVRSALRPGGLFIFDIDSRSSKEGQYWHVQQYHFPILSRMRANGFIRRQRIGDMYVFAALSEPRLYRSLHGGVDRLRYNLPAAYSARVLRKLKRRLGGIVRLRIT